VCRTAHPDGDGRHRDQRPISPCSGSRRFGEKVSENYHLYARKMAEQRTAREANRPLYRQLIELLQFVLECEAAWLD